MKRARSLPAASWAAVAGEQNARLTVARRRRLYTVFPSTKSAVIVEGQSPLWVTSFGSAKPPG